MQTRTISSVIKVALLAGGFAACGPGGGGGAEGERDLDETASSIERSLNDGKADSPDRPTILGDIRPNEPTKAQFRPERRFLAWTFSAEERVGVQIRSRAQARPSSSTFVSLLWQPTCNEPWRTVDRGAGTLSRELPTSGMYLLVSGPRTTNSSGSLEATLGVAPEEEPIIGGAICPPGPGQRPPVPEPLESEPTPSAGAIGASFSVTSGGTASYTIPIVVPPGRAGLQPGLAISYDSAGGNGLLGMRFGLSGLSRITRCGRDLVRDGIREAPALAATDAFCLDGRRLVERRQVDGAHYFTTEAESFSRIRPQGEGPESFVVEAKDGRVLEYGTSEDSRVYSRRVGDTNAIRAWALRRVRDRSGNWMEYRYHNDRNEDGSTREHAPDRVIYTGWDGPGLPALGPNREVLFSYKSQRPDTIDGWTLGSRVERKRRIDGVIVSGPAPTPSGDHGAMEQLRSYSIAYDDSAGLSKIVGVTECASIRQRPGGRVESGCKPPTTFTWEGTSVGWSSERQLPARVDLSGWPTERVYLAGRSGDWWRTVPSVEAPQRVVMPIDMDGDGRTDLLYPSRGSWRVSRALPGGAFEDVDTGVRDPAVSPMDYDGDGRTDLLLHGDATTWRVRISDGVRFGDAVDTGWDASGVLGAPRGEAPSEAFTQIVDIDGDGRDDILYCQGPGWQVALGGRRAPPTVVLPGNCRQPMLLLDVDGDGDVEVLGDGGGVFATATVRTNLPVASLREPPTTHPTTGAPLPLDQTTRVADVNGDGLSDLVHLAFRPEASGAGGAGGRGGGAVPTRAAFEIWINRGDGTFEKNNGVWREDRRFGTGPLIGATFFDFNRDGRADMLLPQDGYASTGTGFVRGLSYPWSGTRPIAYWDAMVVDFDGDGRGEIMVGGAGAEYVFAPDDAPTAPLVVTKIRDGRLAGAPATHPATVTIHHAPQTDRSVYTPSAAHLVDHPEPGLTPEESWERVCTGEWRCFASGRFLVSQVDANNGHFGPDDDLGLSSVRYRYADARVHVRGWGSMGFGQRTIEDLEHPSADPHRTTTMTLDNAHHETAGMVLTERTAVSLTRADGTVVSRISETTAEPHVVPIPGATPAWHAYVGVSTTVEREGRAELRTTRSETNIDSARGCLTDASVTISRGGQREQREHTGRTYHADDRPTWLLCRTDRVIQTSEAVVGTERRHQTRTTSHEYVPGTQLLHSTKREPDGGGDVRATTTLARERGVVTGTTVTAAAGTRTSAVDLDPHSLFPVRKRNALGHVVEVRSHPAWGVPLVVQDENGASTLMAYDAFLRSARIRNPDTSEVVTTVEQRTGGGHVVHVVAGGGSDVTTDHDTLGREVRRRFNVLGGFSVATTSYDVRGRVTQVSRPFSEGAEPVHFAVTDYDDLDRPTRTGLPGGGSVEITYEGLTTTTTDPDGNQTKSERNARGQVFRVTAGLGTPDESITTYDFGPFGALAKVTDHADNVTVVETDAWGRRGAIVDPDTGRSKTTWTGLDEVEVETNAASQEARFVRDDLGRVRERHDADGVTKWDFDTAPWGIGKLASSTSYPHVGHDDPRTHEKKYIYDSLGRPSVTTTVVGGPLGGTYASKVIYDGFSRVAGLWFPASDASGDFAVRYHYDDHGVLSSVARRRNATQDGEVYWRALMAWPDGQIRTEERGNGVVSTRSRDEGSGRLTGIRSVWVGAPDHERPSAPSPATDQVLQDLVYEWTHAGNLHKRDDQLRGQYEEFEYDALSRLRFVHLRPQGDTDGTTETRYDALGNLTFKTAVGDYTYAAPKVVEGVDGVRPHAVSAAGGMALFYDDLGRVKRRTNPAEGLDQTIEYFHFGKPKSASGTRTEPFTWFEYDADGNRLVRDSSPTAARMEGLTHTTTIGDLYERVLVRPDSQPAPGQPREWHRFFVHAGSRLVAQVSRRIEDGAPPSSRTEEVHWVNDDHLGSTDVVTRERGEVVESRSFAALGQARQPAWSDPAAVDTMSSVVPRGFTGHQDDRFGLVNMGGRIYDPFVGRFLQPDPFVQGIDGQGLNRYSYVQNNPMSRIDPSGYLGKDVTGAGAGIPGSGYAGGVPGMGGGVSAWDGGYESTAVGSPGFCTDADSCAMMAQSMYEAGVEALVMSGAPVIVMGGAVMLVSGDEIMAAYGRVEARDREIAIANLDAALSRSSAQGSLLDRHPDATACAFCQQLIGLAQRVGPSLSAAASRVGGLAQRAQSAIQRADAWLNDKVSNLGSLLRNLGAPSAGTAQATVAPALKTIDANRLHHIFGQAKHNLGPLVLKFGGSEQSAYRAVESAVHSLSLQPGLFKVTVQVLGHTVTVKGNVVGDVVHIGTFWM